MAAKKTSRTSSSTTTSSKRTTVKKSPLVTEPPREFSLQMGNGFGLLTERIGDGAMVATRVPAGATLEIGYWKEPTNLGSPITTITLHARIDGELLPSAVIANRDSTGRLLRAPARLELPKNAKHLEYWFELKTEAGEPAWDSNWGNNHWLELTAEVLPLDAEQAPRAEA